MYCKYCGKEIADDSKFCSNCGKALNGSLTTELRSKCHGIWSNLYVAKGYQMEKAHLKLCPECAELAEEYDEMAAESQARRP